VILASKRAKQLLRGSKAKIRTKSKNPIRIAQIEVKEGLIDYEILQSKHDIAVEAEEQVLSVDAVAAAAAEDPDEAEGDVVEDKELVEGAEVEEDADGDYDDNLPGEDVVDGKEEE
jgi:hypothetical protein